MFIPHTDSEREEMLSVIGFERLEDLFTMCPPAYRFPELNLPPALTEMEAVAMPKACLAPMNLVRD